MSSAVAAALAATTLAACSSPASDAEEPSGGASTSASAEPSASSDGSFPVSVAGKLGEQPEVDFSSPLEVEETISEIVIEGQGEPVPDNTPVLLHLYLANGATGDKIGSSYESDSGSPVPTRLSSDAVFPAAYEALAGQPVGTRAAVVARPEDGYGENGMPQLGLEPGQDLVVVVDLISAAPTDYPRLPRGERQKAPAGLPKVETANGEVTGLDFSKASKKPPKGLKLYYLVKGDGKEIETPTFAAINYFGQVWGADAPFDQSFDSEPLVQPIGLGQLIQGWDQGLQGVPAGSRLLLSVPPAQGYGAGGQPSAGISGKDTLLFVIDVLAVG